jgi:hypothetical protein
VQISLLIILTICPRIENIQQRIAIFLKPLYFHYIKQLPKTDSENFLNPPYCFIVFYFSVVRKTFIPILNDFFSFPTFLLYCAKNNLFEGKNRCRLFLWAGDSYKCALPFCAIKRESINEMKVPWEQTMAENFKFLVTRTEFKSRL